MKMYLRMFAPWIAEAAVSSVAHWEWAMLAGAVVAVAVNARAIRCHRADLLSEGTIGFFLVMAAIARVAPDSPLRHYLLALSLATVGVLAVASLIAGRPFTMTFARQRTSPDTWNLPAFYRTNMVITAVYAASFLTSALVCALLLATVPPLTPLWIGLVEVIGLVFPTVFTRRYLARVRAHAVAAR